MNFGLQVHPAPDSPHAGPRAQDIARLAPWFHNLHLPTGEQTAPSHPLGDFPTFKWRQIRRHIPDDLTGKAALDIGCNAGFYAIELAKRGACVVAIDHDPRYLDQARWAAGEFGVSDRITFHAMTVYDLARPTHNVPGAGEGGEWGEGGFDIVLFMGVLYHLRYPLLGLDIAASRLRRGGLFVFQTLTTPDTKVRPTPEDMPISARHRLAYPGWPRMSFIERKLASDPTNWWIPNAACCEAMLRAAGLRIDAQPGHEIYLCAREDDAGEPWREALGPSTAGASNTPARSTPSHQNSTPPPT